MFGWFKRRKKSPDINELEKLAIEDDKEAEYLLSLSYYRDTNLAQNKKKSKPSFEIAPEEDK